jgi:general secretion pathway protein A
LAEKELVAVFLDFFHLQQQPFGVTPNPAYLFPSQTHRDALSDLSSGIQDDRGFLTLIAQPGMGKTTVLYQLLNELRDSARTAFIFQTQCDSRDFFGYLLSELGIQPEGMSLVTMHNRLNQVLFDEMLAGKRFVLVVDEAQNLDDSVLETVRLLSNFERENTKLLQIVLAGQPHLAAKLAQPQLSQLRQRITVMCHLQPFNASETACYIEHRLTVAGYSGGPIFTQDALKLIAQLSGGVPRNINNICYSSLSAAHKRGQLSVNAALVRDVAVRLGLAAPLAQAPVIVAASTEEFDSSDATQPVLSILEKIVASLNGEAHAPPAPVSAAPPTAVQADPVAAEIAQAPAIVPDSVPDFTWELESTQAPASAAAPAAMSTTSDAGPAPSPVEQIEEVVDRPDEKPSAPPALISAAPSTTDRVDDVVAEPAFAMYQEVVLELNPEPEVPQAPQPLAAPAEMSKTSDAAIAPPPVEAVYKVFSDFVKYPPVAFAAPAERYEKTDSDTAPSPVEKYLKVFADVVEDAGNAVAAPAEMSTTSDPAPATLPAEVLREQEEVTSVVDEPAAPEHEPVVADVFEAMSLAGPSAIAEISPVAPAFPPQVDEVLTPIVFESVSPRPQVAATPEKASTEALVNPAVNSPAKKPATHPAAATAAAAWRAEMVRRQMSQPLTYKTHTQSLLKRWLFPTIVLILALAGSWYFSPSILKLARPWLETASASSSPDLSTNSAAPAAKSENSEIVPTTYPADPQDTSEYQVVTVAAEPDETLQMICFLYVGHFDAQLLEQIRFLNPEMKNPDRLEPGQLIRIPLPLKTLKKVTDAADAAAQSPAPAPAPEKHESLINKFWALLQSKK